MSERVTKPLKELAALRVSNVDKKSSPLERPVRLCNYMDVYSGTYLDDSAQYMEATASQREIETFSLQQGDVIITKDSETPDDIGIPAMIDTPVTNLVCGYHLAMLRPLQNEVRPAYLMKQLQSDDVRQYYARRATGSTRYALSTRTIEETPILWVQPDVQEKIAAVLRALDTQIEQTEALIAKQEQVRAGLMQDLFTRGVDKSGRLRPPREEAPELYHETELGWLPKDWSLGSVLRFCTDDRQAVLTGPFGADLGTADFVDDGVALLRIGNVQDRRLKLDALLYVNEAKATLLGKYRITAGDLLFARQGATTGRNCLADTSVEGALINYHIIRVSLDKQKCEPRVVEALFNSWLVTKQIEVSKGRSTREGINTAQIVSLLLPGPTLAEQRSIGHILDLELDTAAKLQRELEVAKMQRAGLMQDLLTGKVPVDALLKDRAAA